jgi:hypothetical protein
MLAHFIQVPFGLLIRDALITDATPVGKFRRLRRAQLHQIYRWNATAPMTNVLASRQRRSRSLRRFSPLAERRLNNFAAELPALARAMRCGDLLRARC